MTRLDAADSAQNHPIEAAIRAAAAHMRVVISDDSAEGLKRFVRVLLLWRARMSLVSQRTAGEVISKHVEDSLAILPLLQNEWLIADLGSGAGFPGMVIGLARPQTRVLLVESRQRRVSFLRAAVRATKATNIDVIGERAEAIVAAGRFHETIDLVVSRAVWKADALAALALPLLRPGGLLVAMAGPQTTSPERCEGYETWKVSPYRLSGGEKRQLLTALKCFT